MACDLANGPFLSYSLAAEHCYYKRYCLYVIDCRAFLNASANHFSQQNYTAVSWPAIVARKQTIRF